MYCLDYCNSLWATPNSVIQPMQKVRNTAARLILSRAPRHRHCGTTVSPTTPPLTPNFLKNKIRNCLSVSQCNHRLRPFFLNCCTFTVLLVLSALHQTHACSNSTDSSTAEAMAFAHSHTSVRTSGTVSLNCYSVPSKANPRHFSSPNISFKQHCPSPLCLYIV